MNINNPFIKQEIKFLKIGYILHFILNILLITSHILVFIKVDWLSKYIYQIIFSEIIIVSVFSLSPIILLIIILCKVLTKKIIKLLELISKIFLGIYLLNSLFTSAVIWYNGSLMKTFYIYCPFNYKTKDIPNMFYNYQLYSYEQTKKKCNYRKCFPFNNDQNIFICNYKENKNQIQFNESSPNNIITINEVKNYYNICQDFVQFFKIKKISINYYNISYNYICPNMKDMLINYILSIFFIFADILASIGSWLLELFSYKKIFLLIIFQVNNRNQANPSLIETNITSRVENNNNQNNNNEEANNISNFIRLPTDIIIVENNKNKNDNNYISNGNKEERIVNILKKNIDYKNMPDTLNDNDINDIKNNDKSEQQFTSNQNIFKVISINNKANFNKEENK